MKTLHFGIEMEMTGITRSRAASLIARFFGTESRHEGEAYDTYIARDEQGREWKAMNDSSLIPQKKVNGNITDASSFYRTEKDKIRVGLEATGHYSSNLAHFIGTRPYHYRY